MEIDFKNEVLKRKDDLLADLFSLLKIGSERDDQNASIDAPFGPKPKEALLKMLEIADRDGFAMTNLDNYAGHFEYGQGAETLGIFGHLDVVPAGSGWDSDPYQPEVRDGKIFARGASDDKGPSLACYYAVKIIKELNLPVSKKIRFIFGTDEESGWGDMDYYFKNVNLPLPDFGFAPDAEFPIINGEKGNITEYLHFGNANGTKFVLEKFTGGLRENMVPESATAIITTQADFEQINQQFARFLEVNSLRGSFKHDGSKITIEVIGKSAHGAMPNLGINGATYLAKFLQNYGFENDANKFLRVAGTILIDDHDGSKLAVNHHDDKMGDVSMNAGIFNFDVSNHDDNTIALNFRYPQGTDPQIIKNQLMHTLSGAVQSITIAEHGHTPHYVPMDDPLVETLLKTYHDHTGNPTFEQVIGGGTFGRLLKRGVAFGAMLPGREDTMHQANEYILVDDLLLACEIYADAIYRLVK